MLAMLVLATVVVPRYADGFQQARIERARGDVRAVADAVTLYWVLTGRLPATLSDLTTSAKTVRGDTVGPFLRVIPAPPSGGAPPWSAQYAYVPQLNGTFLVFAAGDNTVVRAP